MPKTDDKLHFEVHPSVVYQLGESLISDAIQALIELVKNSYDADATYAKITIDTAGAVTVPGIALEPGRPRIVVEDDGFGMDETEVASGWLLISNRAKHALKAAKKTTPGGRTPLGDKGLGRLGVQRLGDSLDIYTKKHDSAAIHFGFSWLDFATAPSLRDVAVASGPCEFPRQKGTTIAISELREIGFWKGADAQKRLTDELSRMISPYAAIRDFMVYIEVDGTALDLLEISDRIRELAPMRYEIKFTGKRFEVTGRARLSYFRPDSKAGCEEFAVLAESDHGQRFFEFLAEDKKSGIYRLSRSRNKQWFVEFCYQRNLDDIDGVHRLPGDGKELANPGPFAGEVDSFDLGSQAAAQQSVFDGLKEYRQHIKQFSGIRVYRDGFAIRVDRDWLKLGAQWTSATSYYGLKPDNTLGFIALSARENMQLEETTDREGFKDTPYFRNFYLLLTEFASFTTGAHGFFRRSWNAFLEQRREQLARVDSRKDIGAMAETIATVAAQSSAQEGAMTSHLRQLDKGLNEARTVLTKAAAGDVTSTLLRRQIAAELDSLTSLLNSTSSAAESVRTYLGQVRDVSALARVLQDRVASLRRQTDDMYQTVALGLTAESISHEVFNITDGLAQRTKKIESKLDGGKVDVAAISGYVEHVRSAALALRKQVSYLSPALRYVRDVRDKFKLLSFLRDLEQFYKTRLDKSGIAMKLALGAEDITLDINRGKLSQVFDNLIVNSEYWLKRDIAASRIRSGTITIEVRPPFVRVFDNGRGIDPSVEGALFEPFITAKKAGEGRGLGLFISKQLLDSEGCHIGILPDRNATGRLYAFQIDVRGAMYG